MKKSHYTDCMETLHITSGLGDGGAEAVLVRLVTYQNDNRHTVVSLMDQGKYGEILRDAGIDVYCLKMPSGRITIAGLWRLFRLIRTKKPDAVQTWMYHADLIGGAVARIAGVSNVCWGIHNTTLDAMGSKRSTVLVAKLCAFTSGFVPRNIVCCASSALTVHENLGYKKESLCVINNGYDVSYFRPNPKQRLAVRSELGLPNATPLFGMVARVDAQKDHDNLLKALKLIRDRGYNFNCCLVGEGVNGRNTILVREINDHGLQDKLILMGQRTDISAIMNALDIHVLSSSFGEAFPNVLCEAMATGTPCVTTDVGDSAFIVGDTGWVVPPRNSEALAASLADALDEFAQTVRWEMRQKLARKKIEESFSLDRMVSCYNKVWRDGI